MAIQYPYGQGYTAADNDDHEAGPEQNWQESVVLVYSDPDNGIAGYQRIGSFRNRNQSDLYTWVQVDGKSVSHAKLTELPLYAGSINDTTVEGVTFSTIEPMHKLRVHVDRDNVVSDLVFESYTGPVVWPMDQNGFKMSSGHYECVGSVKGSVVKDGVVQEVNGVGYIDHSWGPRDYSTVHSCRWMYMAFDEKNHMNCWPLVAPGGVIMNGYLVLDGELSFIKKIESELRVGTDQYHLNGAWYKVTDELGRELELVATGTGEHSIQPFGQALFAIHQPAVFTGLGGRRGIGMIEWTPPKAIPPWELERLNLKADSDWLKVIPGG